MALLGWFYHSRWPARHWRLSVLGQQKWAAEMRHTVTLGLAFVLIYAHLQTCRCRCNLSVFCSIVVHAIVHLALRLTSTSTGIIHCPFFFFLPFLIPNMYTRFNWECFRSGLGTLWYAMYCLCNQGGLTELLFISTCVLMKRGFCLCLQMCEFLCHLEVLIHG